jgi:hypothetical protein
VPPAVHVSTHRQYTNTPFIKSPYISTSGSLSFSSTSAFFYLIAQLVNVWGAVKGLSNIPRKPNNVSCVKFAVATLLFSLPVLSGWSLTHPNLFYSRLFLLDGAQYDLTETTSFFVLFRIMTVTRFDFWPGGEPSKYRLFNGDSLTRKETC